MAGSIPVVVGPPNIQDFAPAPNSYLYIKHADDVKGVAAKMKFLAENATAYNDTIR
jgi:glycoprotein 3-alpha-L-fucosyltransferase